MAASQGPGPAKAALRVQRQDAAALHFLRGLVRCGGCCVTRGAGGRGDSRHLVPEPNSDPASALRPPH